MIPPDDRTSHLVEQLKQRARIQEEGARIQRAYAENKTGRDHEKAMREAECSEECARDIQRFLAKLGYT